MTNPNQQTSDNSLLMRIQGALDATRVGDPYGSKTPEILFGLNADVREFAGNLTASGGRSPDDSTNAMALLKMAEAQHARRQMGNAIESAISAGNYSLPAYADAKVEAAAGSALRTYVKDFAPEFRVEQLQKAVLGASFGGVFHQSALETLVAEIPNLKQVEGRRAAVEFSEGHTLTASPLATRLASMREEYAEKPPARMPNAAESRSFILALAT